MSVSLRLWQNYPASGWSEMISTWPSQRWNRLCVKPRPSRLYATRGLPRSYVVIRHIPTCSQRSRSSTQASTGKASTLSCLGKSQILDEIDKIMSLKKHPSAKIKLLSLDSLSSHPSSQTEEGSGPVGGEREGSGLLSAGTAEKYQLQSQVYLHRWGGLWPAQGGPQSL